MRESDLRWEQSHSATNKALQLKRRILEHFAILAEPTLRMFQKISKAVGEPRLFWFLFIFTLNSSVLDHSATAPPPPHTQKSSPSEFFFIAPKMKN